MSPDSIAYRNENIGTGEATTLKEHRATRHYHPRSFNSLNTDQKRTMIMHAEIPHILPKRHEKDDPSLSYPDIVLTENALCDCLADATAGVVITYHVGLLTVDRDPKLSKLPPERRDELVAIADLAMRLSDAGWAHLLQRRVAVECFAYLLVVRPGPQRMRSASAPALRAFFLAEAA